MARSLVARRWGGGAGAVAMALRGVAPSTSSSSLPTDAAAEGQALRSLATASATAVPSDSGKSSNGSLGKRFYKKAHVKPVADDPSSLEIALDHRVLRTPAKKPLRFSNPALAYAVAAEWEWQDRSGIRSFTMPLMKLTAISIDQIPKDRERIISTLLKYCHTDALCCRASPESVLHGKQATRWDPLLEWMEREMGARPVSSTSIFGANQPQEVVTAFENCLRVMTDWELAAIDSLAGSARSLVVALAIARGKLSIEEAIEVIRLEENHQVEEWGYVEGGHDVDEADIRVRITAAYVFLKLIQAP